MFTFKLNRYALVCAMVFGVIANHPSEASVINLATGLDAANNLLATGGQSDAHWTVDQPTGGQGPAQTVFPNNADWYGGWASNGPNSD